MKRYLVVFAVCLTIMSCLFGTTLAMAGEDKSASSCPRYYKTVEVQNGDSLWTLAETYNEPDSGMDIRGYISEVKSINRMGSDRINAGDSLTVICFGIPENE